VVRRTGIGAVMASYNEIDGIPSHANRWLLTDVLRGEWGFDGLLVSDYYAIDQLVDLHHVAADRADAAVLALRAGVDLDLPDGGSFSTLVGAVRSGRVSEAEIDAPLRRFLAFKFRAGLFEQPYADLAAAEAITNNREARALALEAARRSIILLKNDGMLPLSLPGNGERPRIAVIGPNADVARLGGYSGQPPETVSLLQGIRQRVGERAEILHARGVDITVDDDWWGDTVELADPARNRERIREAVELARQADLVVLAIGDTEQTSREGWAPGHLGDRASLALVGEQQALFDALQALGKPIAVVLINGRPLGTVAIAERANALVEAWYVGERGGQALAEVLFGDVNPGGKLPVTVPRHVGQLPLAYDVKPSALRGYLFDTTEPLFPFGFGLSYSRFDIGEPRLVQASVAAGEPVELRVSVRNTGERAGDETVQVYLRDRVSSVTQPVKELKAFQRVTLAPGEERELHFTLPPAAFELWNDRMQRVIEPGEFDIMVGPDSVQLKGTVLRIEGDA
jgi:beta-glucosidase